MSVVLPAPLPPSRPWTSLRPTVRSTPSRATTGPNVLRMPSMCRRGRGSCAVLSVMGGPSLDRREVLLDHDLARPDVGDGLLDLRGDGRVDVLRRLDRDPRVEAERVVAVALARLDLRQHVAEGLGEVIDRGGGVVLRVELRLVGVLRRDDDVVGLALEGLEGADHAEVERTDDDVVALADELGGDLLGLRRVVEVAGPDGRDRGARAAVLERLVDRVD